MKIFISCLCLALLKLQAGVGLPPALQAQIDANAARYADQLKKQAELSAEQYADSLRDQVDDKAEGYAKSLMGQIKAKFGSGVSDAFSSASGYIKGQVSGKVSGAAQSVKQHFQQGATNAVTKGLSAAKNLAGDQIKNLASSGSVSKLRGMLGLG